MMLPDVDLQFIPVAQFSQRFREGWMMLPEYPLKAGDYAVLMLPPPMTIPAKSNVKRAHLSRYAATLRKEAVRVDAKLRRQMDEAY